MATELPRAPGEASREGRHADSLKVDHLVRQTCLVLKAEGVLSLGIGCKDVVSLFLCFSFEENLVVGIPGGRKEREAEL